MIVLGIDTATAVAAVGVVQEGTVRAEVFEASRTGHAALLPELVRLALKEAATSLAELDRVAVSLGPGSFTGLRVGVSFAKGIAYSATLPLVGVDTFEALAWLAPAEFPQIATVTDARKGEVYLALFRRSGDGVERLTEEAAASPEEAVATIRDAFAAGRGIVVGDAAEAYPESFRLLARTGVRIAPFVEIHPRGSAVAMLGEKRPPTADQNHAERVLPRYVRASAAEINLQRRSPVAGRGAQH